MMNKNLLRTATLSLLAIGIGLCTPAASADETVDDVLSKAFGHSHSANHVADFDTVQNDETAEILLNLEEGRVRVLEVESGVTLGEALTDHSVRPELFRTENDESVPLEEVLAGGSTLTLHKLSSEATTEEFTLPFPSTTEETDELYIGEEEVSVEGVDGSALRTVVVTVNGASGAVTKQEKISILSAPVAEVTRVGTKERPAPVRSSRAAAAASANSGSPAVGTSLSGSTGVLVREDDAVEKAELMAIDEVVTDARLSLLLEQVGKPYVWGSAGPASFDCSGLVLWVYSQTGGVSLPHKASAQGAMSTPVSRADMLPGDIVWSAAHIGVYVGNGKMVHAANPSRGVVIDNVDWYLNNGFRIGRL